MCSPSLANAEQHGVGGVAAPHFPKVPLLLLLLQQGLGWGHRLAFLNLLPSDDRETQCGQAQNLQEGCRLLAPTF